MVGRTTYQCGICFGSLPSRNAYNQHMANHTEAVAPELSCSVCSFKFADSFALENHKAQTGHTDEGFECDKCGRKFQTQAKFKQHRQFPSPCYADAPRGPTRTTTTHLAPQSGLGTTPTQSGGQGGYVDLDNPAPAPVETVLPYDGSPVPTARSSTPTDVSGVYCHTCKTTFSSEALYSRHCLSCTVNHRPAGQENARLIPDGFIQAPKPTRATSAKILAAAARPKPTSVPLKPFSLTHNSSIASSLASSVPTTTVCDVHGCGRTFGSASALLAHKTAKHGDAFPCDVRGCKKSFVHAFALDQHKETSHKAGIQGLNASSPRGLGGSGKASQSAYALDQRMRTNRSGPFTCGIGGCARSFQSASALEQHKRANHSAASHLDVGGRGKSFQSTSTLDQHAKASHSTTFTYDSGGFGRVSKPASAMDQHKSASHCAPFNCNVVGCSKSFDSASALEQHKNNNHNTGGHGLDANYICKFNSCRKPFRSEAGWKQHMQDNHGVGSGALGMHSTDSSRLPQHVREQRRQNMDGLTSSGAPPQQPPRAPVGGGRGAPSTRHLPRAPQAVQHTPHPLVPPTGTTAGVNAGGSEDMGQARELQAKIMRLLITADITIQHGGSIVYDDISCVRISVANQTIVHDKFKELVHLPETRQAHDYAPPPKAFKDVIDYDESEFTHLPDRRGGPLRSDVVVLCCSKILLANGCEEVVKIAAVDVLTGCPLMSYLVCTDPTEMVQDWRTAETGFRSFRDLEAARSQKFKVLKGWKATRAALSKFADRNTILLGHNLRSELDALRIIHGRSVDLMKCVEKAAGGPLSRQSLRLEKLFHGLKKAKLPAHPVFGRDCLKDAFAIRELALWILKNNDELVEYAKEKSLDYQKVSAMSAM